MISSVGFAVATKSKHNKTHDKKYPSEIVAVGIAHVVMYMDWKYKNALNIRLSNIMPPDVYNDNRLIFRDFS